MPAELPEIKEGVVVHPGDMLMASLPDLRTELAQENERLHLEIRGLNGQLEGLTRVMAGLRNRIAELQREIAELKSAPSD